MPVPVYKCTLAEDPDAPKLDHDVSVGNYYWVPGEHAKAARDELESGRSTLASDLNTLTRMHIQKADGPNPKSVRPSPKPTGDTFTSTIPKTTSPCTSGATASPPENRSTPT